MATIQADTNLCVYCYKTVIEIQEVGVSGNCKYQLDTHKRFLNLLSRQFNVRADTLYSEVNAKYCTDCSVIIKTFCDLYHQIKCLELELNWQVDKFLNVMKLADRVPSRVKLFKHTAYQVSKIKFRKTFKRKCKTYLSHSFPRVSVSNTQTAKVTKIETHINQSHSTLQRDNLPNPNENNNSSMCAQGQRNIHEHLFLGWITTLSALFFLCHVQTFENSQVEIESELLSVDANHEELINISSPLSYQNEDYSNVGCESPIYSTINDDLENEPNDYPPQLQVTKQEKTEIETQPVVNFPFQEAISVYENDLNCEFDGPESNFELKTTEIRDQVLHNTRKPLALPVQNESDIKLNTVSMLSPSTSNTETIKSKERTKKELIKKREATAPSTTFERRSLRTKYQCSKCKATFSEVHKYESHVKACNQPPAQTEFDLQLEEYNVHDEITGDDDNAKVEVESCTSGSSSEDDATSSKDKTERRTVKISPHSRKKRHISDNNTCKRCIPNVRFSWAKCLQSHENYKHSNGRIRMYPSRLLKTDIKLLKLDGVLLSAQYGCNVDKCTKKFDLPEELENHAKLHGVFSCPICDLSFDYATSLIKHELEHSLVQQQTQDENFKRGEIFACTRCEFKHQSENFIINHYLSEHLELPIIQAKCSICQQTFSYRERVTIQHYINYHDLNRLDNPANRVNCSEPDCSAYFLTEDQMHVHWNRQHVAGCTSKESIHLLQTTETIYEKQYAKEMQKHKRQSCPYCHKAFQYQSDVQAHIVKRHGKEAGYQNQTSKIGQLVISKEGITVDDIVLEQNAKYFCKVNKCEGKFREEEDFQSHSKLHGEFSCNFCENVENFAVELAIHEMVHVKVIDADSFEEKLRRRPKVYKCSRCPYKVGKRIRYLGHFLTTHLELKMDRTRCPICKFVYDHDTYNKARSLRHLKDGVYQHFIKWHDFTGVEGGEEKCGKRCQNCPAIFRTKLQLLYHNEEVHNPDRLKSEDDWGNVCVDCGKDMIDRNGLLKHRRLVHKKKTNFTCEVVDCGKKFETCIELINHDTHAHRSNEVLICTECGKKFFNNFALLSHMRSHEEKVEVKMVKRKHVCEQCGKSFRDRSQLEIHYKFHNGPESWEFECEICKKKLSSKQKLEQHRRTHTKEKPFVCQVCGMAYAHRHNLRNHTNSKHKEVKDVARNIDTTNFASWRKGKKLK